MTIPVRDLIALAAVAVFFAATFAVIVYVLVRKAYKDGYEAGKAEANREAHTIHAPTRHPVYMR